jgi:hypothetical protein
MLRRSRPGLADRSSIWAAAAPELVWHRASRASLTASTSPLLRARRSRSDVMLGDLRRLIRDGIVRQGVVARRARALPRPALTDAREANRVLADGGALFVYTHVRKNGRSPAHTARQSIRRLLRAAGAARSGQSARASPTT